MFFHNENKQAKNMSDIFYAERVKLCYHNDINKEEFEKWFFTNFKKIAKSCEIFYYKNSVYIDFGKRFKNTRAGRFRFKDMEVYAKTFHNKNLYHSEIKQAEKKLEYEKENKNGEKIYKTLKRKTNEEILLKEYKEIIIKSLGKYYLIDELTIKEDKKIDKIKISFECDEDFNIFITDGKELLCDEKIEIGNKKYVIIIKESREKFNLSTYIKTNKDMILRNVSVSITET